MPWSNQGGGGWQGGGRGPWGQGPRSPGGSQPPNLDELLRRGQERLRGMLPGGFSGLRGILLGLGVIVLIWAASGFYRVSPDEQGVVLRFGQWIKTTEPGLNYHLPYPIETVLTPRVTRVGRIDIGFRTGETTDHGTATRPVDEESLMLTGDENIVDIDFSVFWVIKDAGQYLFNVEDPEATIKAVAESAMREVIARNQIQRILTEGRAPIEAATQKLMQQILDSYQAGVEVTQVNLQKADPPAAVIAAFRDVQAAKADKEREQNIAEAYSNDIIPRARGDAEKIVLQAEAYRQKVIAESQGEAARFLSVLTQYRLAKDATVRRMYLDTMEQVLAGVNKVIVDEPKGGTGVLPYLPLPALKPQAAPPAPPAPMAAPPPVPLQAAPPPQAANPSTSSGGGSATGDTDDMSPESGGVQQ